MPDQVRHDGLHAAYIMQPIDPQVEGGVLGSECAALLKRFFQLKRKK